MRQFFGLGTHTLCIAALSLGLSAGQCHSQRSDGPASDANNPFFAWDSDKVKTHLATLAAEPHPLGSLRQLELAQYIEGEARSYGLTVMRDDFTVQVPDPALLHGASSVMQTLTLAKSAQNIFAKLAVPQSSCIFLLASHYDSKRLDGEVSLGANDSGSSSAALLEIMRQLTQLTQSRPLRCSVLAVWFDGEEAYLRDWRDGETRHPAQQADHLYGSRRLAEQLASCGNASCLPSKLGGERVEAMVLLDMIGMPRGTLSWDSFSTPELVSKAKAIDKRLYGGRLFASFSKPIEDDHLPFLAKGIPAIDLINFEDTSTWHTSLDRLENISLDSLRDIAQLALHLIYEL